MSIMTVTPSEDNGAMESELLAAEEALPGHDDAPLIAARPPVTISSGRRDYQSASERKDADVRRLTDMGLRQCNRCRTVQALDGFSRLRSSLDGFSQTCRPCVRRYGRIRAGVSPEFAGMEPPADWACEICDGDGGTRGLFLDHDHASGVFRGWLCHACNAAIGLLRDDPSIIAGALGYVIRTST